MLPSQGNRSGSAILDSTPPSPSDKVYKKPVPPGSDTKALLGGMGADDIDGGGSGGVMSSTANKFQAFVALMMQATLGMESLVPGSVPEPVKQWASTMVQMAPSLIQSLNQQPDPTAMLSAVGGSAAASPTAATNPMGSPAMGMQAMGMGGRPPAAGSPAGPGAGVPTPKDQNPRVAPIVLPPGM